jgi:hypothetical protein
MEGPITKGRRRPRGPGSGTKACFIQWFAAPCYNSDCLIDHLLSLLYCTAAAAIAAAAAAGWSGVLETDGVQGLKGLPPTCCNTGPGCILLLAFQLYDSTSAGQAPPCIWRGEQGCTHQLYIALAVSAPAAAAAPPAWGYVGGCAPVVELYSRTPQLVTRRHKFCGQK